MRKGHEIEIELGESKGFESHEWKTPPSKDSSFYTAVYGRIDEEALPIYIHETALRGIEQHAASAGNEVGGALLGQIQQADGTTYVVVEDFLPAKNANEREATLTFTHETWTQLNIDREQKCPELRMVGWYHTHPGMGIFLSDSDQFIQKNFFSKDGMIALVVDPVSSDRGVFYWSGNKLEGTDGFYIFGEKSRRKDIDDLIARIAPLPQASQRSGLRGEQGEAVVVYKEVMINWYYLLPGFLRRIFGIKDARTAPRSSLKTITIAVLLCVVAMQWYVINNRLSEPERHLQYARAAHRAGDLDTASVEYCKYFTLKRGSVQENRDYWNLLNSPNKKYSSEYQRTSALRGQARNMLALAGSLGQSRSLFNRSEPDYAEAVELCRIILSKPEIASIEGANDFNKFSQELRNYAYKVMTDVKDESGPKTSYRIYTAVLECSLPTAGLDTIDGNKALQNLMIKFRKYADENAKDNQYKHASQIQRALITASDNPREEDLEKMRAYAFIAREDGSNKDRPKLETLTQMEDQGYPGIADAIKRLKGK